MLRFAQAASPLGDFSVFPAGVGIASKRGETGLVNRRGEHNCFLNVVLQALFNCERLRVRLLLEGPWHRCCRRARTEECVTCSLLSVFRQMSAGQDGAGAAADPSVLRRALDAAFEARKQPETLSHVRLLEFFFGLLLLLPFLFVVAALDAGLLTTLFHLQGTDLFRLAQMNDASESLSGILNALHRSLCSAPQQPPLQQAKKAEGRRGSAESTLRVGGQYEDEVTGSSMARTISMRNSRVRALRRLRCRWCRPEV